MMKRTLCVLAVIFCTSATFAQGMADKWRDGTNSWRGLIGSSQGGLNIGIDYERRMGNAGLGAYLINSDDNDAGKGEQMFLGVQSVIHVLDRTAFDVYLAPGLSVVMHDDGGTTSGDNETTFGPSLRIGTIYYCNPHWGIGLDWLKTTNWFSDDAGYQQELANVAVSYTY